MRSDMAKVIVERPRLRGGVGFPRAGADDQVRREGMRRPWIYKGRYKGLNENLAPLERFLRSNVGRPWDKVYSEICAQMDRKSAVQLHIWQHLWQFVCRHPIRDGRQFVRVNGDPLWQEFVVDPKSGLLLENKHRWRWPKRSRRRAPSSDFIPGKDKCYRRIDDIWYEFELAPLPLETAGLVDVALKRKLSETSRQELISYHGAEVYATRKRQLNKKEIRRVPQPR